MNMLRLAFFLRLAGRAWESQYVWTSASAIYHTYHNIVLVFIFLIVVIVIIVVLLAALFIVVVIPSPGRVVLIVVIRNWPARSHIGSGNVILVDFGHGVEVILIRARVVVIVVARHCVGGPGEAGDALWAEGKLSQELVEAAAGQARGWCVSAGSAGGESRFGGREREIWYKGRGGVRSGDVLLF
jgi:hypothetical protein